MLKLYWNHFSGEYSNLPQEELIEWINSTLPEDASLTGNYSLIFIIFSIKGIKYEY